MFMAKAKVISVSGQRKEKEGVKPPSSKEKVLKKLKASFNKGTILTGQITGVTTAGDTVVAVVLIDGYRVLIPVTVCVPLTDKEKQRGKDSFQYVLSKRLFSEIDFIITGIDEQNDVAVGDRFKAMEKRKEIFFEKNEDDGEYRVYENCHVEARVVVSLKAGIVVEIFGVEVFIPSRELDHRRTNDATDIYSQGDIVVCKLTKIVREEIEITGEDGKKRKEKLVELEASIKQTKENPFKKLIKDIDLGGRYTGVITYIDKKGHVFVALDAGMDILCKYPEKGDVPVQGMKVSVVITGKNEEQLRLFGHISHMARVV